MTARAADRLWRQLAPTLAAERELIAVLLMRAVAQYGVTGLARRLAREPSTVSRWLAGRRKVPRAVRLWLVSRY